MLVVLFLNSTICSPIYAADLFEEVVNEAYNGENTEGTVDDLSVGSADSVASPSSVIADVLDDIENIFEDKVSDDVVSGAALDYTIDESNLPGYVLSLLNDSYNSLSDDDKFQLNTYLYVRSDTMEECCNNGYSVKDSIPYALLMQTMDIDLSTAVDMVATYASQNSALESANMYSSEQYQYHCFKNEDLKKTLQGFVIQGYQIDKLLKAYAVAVYMDKELSEVLPNTENTLSDDVSGDIKAFSEEYFVKKEIAEEILSTVTLDEFKQYFDEITKILKEGDEDADLLASVGSSDSGFDSTFKRGPLSYVEGLGASVDPNTGSILYTENICNIPGVAGLDLNINLYYTSSCPVTPKSIDARVNYAYNWRYSFAYMVDKKGGPLDSTYPRYLTLSNGDTYEMLYVADYGYYVPSSCYSDELKLYEDINHQGRSDSRYKLVYKNGNIDYFNSVGLWIMTVDKFGNKIEVTEGKTNLMKIKDTNGNIVTISTNGYVQTITKPDGSQVVINYSQNSFGAYKRTSLDKITKSGNVTTEFSYDFSDKDNYKNALLNKIKMATGLEEHFTYDWTDRLKYTWNNFQRCIDYEADKYDYARIKEEYLTVDGKICNKKNYSYNSNFMVANSNFATICVCDCACYPYLIGGVWDCNKLCQEPDSCNRPDCPYVYINRGNNSNYSTTVTNENGTTTKYTYNSLKQNILTEEYSGGTLLNKTERDFINYIDICDLPKTVKYTENGAERTEKYTYTGLYDVRTYSVYTNDNKELSSVSYEYDYDSSNTYYGIPTKITTKMDDSTSVVQTNTLLNDGTSMSGKVISKSVIARGEAKESAVAYSYDDKGRVTATNEYIDTNESQYVRTANTYSDSISFAAKPVEVKVDGWDGTTKYVYDTLGRTLSVTKPNNTKESYSYDGIGNVTRVGYFDGSGSEKSSVSLQYDYNNNTIRYTNENGNVEVYDYDPVGNPASVTKVGTVVSTYTYDTRLRPETYTEGKAVTTYGYDNRDRLTSEIVREGSTVLSNKTYSYENNSTGLKTIETINGDSSSATVSNITQADVLGRNVMENKAGNTTYYTYDKLGNAVKSQNYITALSDRTVYLTMDYTYDSAGNVLSTTRTDDTDTAAATHTYASYDMLGRMITSTDGNGNKTEYTYNVLGLVTNKKAPFSLDNGGNMQYTNYGYTYDAVGNVIKDTVTDGVTNEYAYDYKNNVTQVKTGEQVVDYTYDAVGNMTEYKTANGTQVHKYAYNSFGNVTQYTDALGNSETYTYDSNQDMVKKVDRNGNAVTYTYDGLHRKLTEKADGVNNSWTYGLTGGVLTESNDNVVKTYTYNYQGLPNTENTKIGSDTFGIRRNYDSRGNDREDYYYKNGTLYEKRKYIYDNKNRIAGVGIASPSDTAFTQKVTYFYDLNDNLVSAYYGNNSYDTYSYNAANLVTRKDLIHQSNNSKSEELVYNYRLDGNMSSKTETYNDYTNTTAYTYDSTGRLTNETVSGNDNFGMAYTYDEAGNRSSMTFSVNSSVISTENYSYDSNNRLTGSVKKNKTTSDYVDYSYDKNGNQTKVEKYSVNNDNTFRLKILSGMYQNGTSTEKFTYNGLNQLVNYENTNGSYNNKVGLSAQYKYMANGYRVSKTVNDLETRYLWDKDNIVANMTGNNVISHKYYRGVNLICNDSDIYYMHDAHGNMIEMYDGNSGYPDSWYMYNAFGTQNYFYDTDDVRAGQPWGYCDQYYDWETQNYYMRARHYNPASGRFITEDPIKDGSNWYSYCGGNPIKFFDFSGLSVQLRKWVESKSNEISYVKSSIAWDVSSKIARVTMSNNTMSLTANFIPGENGAYIGSDNKMYVSNERTLWNIFGQIIDPPLEVHPIRDAIVIGVVSGTVIKLTGYATLGAIKYLKADTAVTSADTVYYRGKEILNKFNTSNAYVKGKHLASSKGNGSKFLGSSKAASEIALKEAIKNGRVLSITEAGITKMGNPQYEYIIDAGKQIGTRGETLIKIILSSDGGMITAYPKK